MSKTRVFDRFPTHVENTTFRQVFDITHLCSQKRALENHIQYDVFYVRNKSNLKMYGKNEIRSRVATEIQSEMMKIKSAQLFRLIQGFFSKKKRKGGNPLEAFGISFFILESMKRITKYLFII